jgi:hypothetical protein
MTPPPPTPDVYLALFADDTCLCATDRKEGFVVRTFQRGLNSVEIGLSAGILQLMKIRLRGSTFLTVIDRLGAILH